MDKQTVFIGDSLIERFDKINDYKHIYNQGVGGDKTIDIISRLDAVYRINPDALYLLVGINDILANHSVFGSYPTIDINRTYESIVKNLKKNLPRTKLNVISLLPVCHGPFLTEDVISIINRTIDDMNKYIKELSEHYEITFINLNTDFKDDHNKLDENYTIDGVHLSKLGYKKFFKEISKFCNNF